MYSCATAKLDHQPVGFGGATGKKQCKYIYVVCRVQVLILELN